MPKNTEISTILIIGAGPIVVGQACEFDYSGTQGAKALKEEGYRVILVNSNPATIMTDPTVADATYLEPITPEFITQIIEKERNERPNEVLAILPTLGGQTALNVTLELDALGVLKKYGVKLLGANVEAINIAEDRGLFKKAMAEIGIECPANIICEDLDFALMHLFYSIKTAFSNGSQESTLKGIAKHYGVNYTGNIEDFHKNPTFEKAFQKATNHANELEKQGVIFSTFTLPAIIRPSLTLGGTGGGVANTIEEFITLVKSGLDASPINQIQIDESLIGWKEYEMEVIRDRADNAIIVCSIENIDPMGIHTGDSITLAPIMTLTDKEYQIMRNASIAILRKVGVETGGSNVQFAVNPKDGRMVVIEMNPRVSRSSALASKATGFPIAKVAAKLAVGYTLDELRNDIACFIPKEFEYVAFKQVMEAIAKTKQNGEGMEDCAKYLGKNNQYEKIFSYIQSQREQGVSELKLNQQVLPASFEPAIDYVVVKIPKFNFEKFSDIKKIPELGTQMQSIGEVMAIGRCFEESFMKAVSSMEEGFDSLKDFNEEQCKAMLKMRIPNRFLYIFRAFELGISNEEIIEITQYDPWFIERFHKIYEQFQKLSSTKENAKLQQFKALNDEEIFEAKHYGIRDLHIRERLEIPAGKKGKHLFKDYRVEKGIRPVFKKVDTCANEFATKTNYFYSTYEEGFHNEAPAIVGKKCVIVGSGPNRIGQGIEFDYACVHGAYALREIGVEPIIVNCNPETVSTDYDTSTRLYFEPVIDEHIMAVIENELEIPCNAKINGRKVSTIFEIYQEAIRTDFKFEFEIDGKLEKVASRTDFSQFLSQFLSVIIQFGGQTPLKLRETLFEYAIPILGMQNDTIDICDHREKFSPMLDSLGLKYPKTYEFTNQNELESLAEKLNYNFIVRPSSVIGGRGMAIITTKDEFDFYEYVSGGIVNEMLQDATEFDCDAIRDKNGNVFICGVMEHIEYAGVHSGDSACVLPPYSASLEVQQKIEETTYKIAQKLGVIGLINIQYAVKDGEVFVIEANPRCSRTMPFIAKASGFPIIKVATKLMNGMNLEEIPEFKSLKFKEKMENFYALRNLPHFAVKEAVFSFEKFPNADLILGPEMKSTGEIIGISKNLDEAFAKAVIATKYKLPKKGVVFVSLKDSDKSSKALAMVEKLHKNGFEFYSTKGTQEFLAKNGIECKLVAKISESSNENMPNVIDMIAQKQLHLIINTTQGRRSLTDAFSIRRATVMSRLLYATTLESAVMIVRGIDFQNKNGGLKIFTSLQEIV
jgi:carbamoyl-phosphate synthase large subunit